jgi:hypothetical protein
MAAFNTIRLKRFAQKQSRSCIKSWRNDTCASCAILPTSAGGTGCTRDAATAIIVNATVDASTPSSETVADAMMTSQTTRRVSPSAQTRISSTVTCMAKTLNTHTKSAMPTRTTRKHPPRHAQTTTTTIVGTTATARIIATLVVTTSRTGVTILPCPARARLVQVAQAKRRRIIILIMMVKFTKNGGRLLCPLALRRTKKTWTLIWDRTTRPKTLISMTA